MFTGGPQALSAAVLGENQVIDSLRTAINIRTSSRSRWWRSTPKEGTVWADHPVGIVQRDWVTPEHREAAQLFIDYLFKEESQQKAMKYGFRPGSDQVKLAAPIDEDHGVNPDGPRVTLDVPGADVLRAGLDAWRRNKKHAHVILVMDRSVGMNFSDKMTNAKAGARQVLSTLGDEDRLGLLAFSDAAVWAEKDAPMKDARDPMTRAIDALSPGGETALYDAIGEAYGELQNCAQPDEINALVVLTSGDDNRSKTRLDELLGRIRADAGRKAIRVFTIAYGDEAGEKAARRRSRRRDRGQMLPGGSRRTSRRCSRRLRRPFDGGGRQAHPLPWVGFHPFSHLIRRPPPHHFHARPVGLGVAVLLGGPGQDAPRHFRGHAAVDRRRRRPARQAQVHAEPALHHLGRGQGDLAVRQPRQLVQGGHGLRAAALRHQRLGRHQPHRRRRRHGQQPPHHLAVQLAVLVQQPRPVPGEARPRRVGW